MLSNGGAPLVWEHFFCCKGASKYHTAHTDIQGCCVIWTRSFIYSSAEQGRQAFPLTIHYTTEGGCFNVIEAF